MIAFDVRIHLCSSSSALLIQASSSFSALRCLFAQAAHVLFKLRLGDGVKGAEALPQSPLLVGGVFWSDGGSRRLDRSVPSAWHSYNRVPSCSFCAGLETSGTLGLLTSEFRTAWGLF